VSRRQRVPCLVDVAHTADSFHAHAIPQDIVLRPGDRVLVHGAPACIVYGEHLRRECYATVARAGLVRRCWTRWSALLALKDLFEVGFQPRKSA
jgi:hypothetical protein